PRFSIYIKSRTAVGILGHLCRFHTSLHNRLIATETAEYATKMLKKTNSILLGLSVLAALVGAGHAISCLVYGHEGIEGLRGTPTVVECGSAVTTCRKISIVRYHSHSPTTYKANFSSTAYTGDCGACIGIFPSYYTCTNCTTDQCNSAFGAVRAAAPLTLTVPLLMAAALRSF
ncbi:hypothetical protein BOX15_Mlig020027g1, partial [Macrostomum lignano]